ncbi:MAG: transposase [Anaerolineaceae bacterium]|nr:transposase [Anaerolineaceae bacterium]
MAPTTRQISDSGYYHLILRGNSKQVLFEGPADYSQFLHNLKQYSSEHKIIINAYCLMENHVHLLVCDKEQNVSQFMKRLAGNYALWFNRKYQRSGHLFENRYTSVAITSDWRLCTVFRYILNNPRKAGICAAADYPWSSYTKYGNPNSFVDTKILVELLGSFEEYNAFLNEKYEDEDFIITASAKKDQEAKSIIKEIMNADSGTALQSYDSKTRNEIIKKLRQQGLSVRQIERLTGISRGIIQRCM